MPSRQQASKTPIQLRDRLATPWGVYTWLSKFYKFDIDLAAEESTAKCDKYFTKYDDALTQPWHTYGKCGFLNPPYSDQRAWITKAIHESMFGFTTVMLLPTINGQAYWELIARHAAIVINVIGRLSFIAPERFEKNGKVIEAGEVLSGNDSGSCVVVFLPGRHPLETYYVKREHIYGDKIQLETRAGARGGLIEPIVNTVARTSGQREDRNSPVIPEASMSVVR